MAVVLLKGLSYYQPASDGFFRDSLDAEAQAKEAKLSHSQQALLFDFEVRFVS
jgi:hypothetical protein